MPVEIFTQKRGKNSYTTSPFITITKNGQIIFNKKVVEKYLNNEEFCILGYDKDAQEIHIEISDIAKHYYSFCIAKDKNRKTKTIAACNFLDYFKIDRSMTRRYENIRKEGDKIIVSLKHEHPEKTS